MDLPQIHKSPTPPQIFINTSNDLENPDSIIRTPSSGGLTPTRYSCGDSDVCSHLSKDESDLHSSPRPSRVMDSAAQELKRLLEDVQCECGPGSGRYIVPRNEINSKITEPEVAKIIQAYVEDDKVAAYSRRICASCKQLFCVLIDRKKPEEIITLIREDGIADDDLPFRRNVKKEEELNMACFLEGNKGKPIKSLERWDKRDRKKFSDKQHMFTAVVFERGQHYELDDSAILPFIDRNDEKIHKIARGGYGMVLMRTIHHSHHHFCVQNANSVSWTPKSSVAAC